MMWPLCICGGCILALSGLLVGIVIQNRRWHRLADNRLQLIRHLIDLSYSYKEQPLKFLHHFCDADQSTGTSEFPYRANIPPYILYGNGGGFAVPNTIAGCGIFPQRSLCNLRSEEHQLSLCKISPCEEKA